MIVKVNKNYIILEAESKEDACKIGIAYTELKQLGRIEPYVNLYTHSILEIMLPIPSIAKQQKQIK
jgi:hypothetical protein